MLLPMFKVYYSPDDFKAIDAIVSEFKNDSPDMAKIRKELGILRSGQGSKTYTLEPGRGLIAQGISLVDGVLRDLIPIKR